MTHSSPLALFGLVLVLGLASAGCSKSDRSEASSAPPAVPEPAAAQAAGPGAPVAAAQRALRITIETTLAVRDLDSALDTLRTATDRRGGHVAQAHTIGTGKDRSASVELKVPVGEVSSFRSEIGRMGDVVSVDERAEDVTEQVADVAARLKNARTQEARLLDLLTNRTGNLADVVAIEKEVASVRETIERMEAQQRVLEGQTSYADVQVHLVLEAPPVGAPARIAHAAHDGVAAARAVVLGLCTVTAMVAPTLLVLLALGAAIFFGVRRVLRLRQPLGH